MVIFACQSQSPHMIHKDTHNCLFLLGGHDLEMLEIRHLLDSVQVPYLDGNLGWSNACLSAYGDFLRQYPEKTYYGVELKEDINPPANYTRIDHHNDCSDRPASVLQVACLLGVAPDRYLQLVAANDAGYIPAMQEMGASKEEIADIRRQDRAAQGVTPEEERLAELSVSEHKMIFGDTIIVHSLTSRFSPICDCLFPYKRLLIYTDSEWTFYGDGKSDWVDALSEDIRCGRIYHGGGPAGFIGTVRNTFSKEQIEQFALNIVERYAHD